MYQRARPDEAPSPALSLLSVKSDQSMDRPIAFNNAAQSYMGEKARPDEAPSPALSHLSMKSDQSMDRPIAFSNETPSYIGLRPAEAPSPATSYFSLKSNQSMDRPIAFKDRSQLYSDKCTLSATLLTEDHYRCPVCSEVFKDPVSMPCGHSYCKHCIEIYWSKPAQAGGYACPQCRKRFRGRPVLSVNVALSKLIEELQKAGFSPALPAHCYAGPEDVPCDICAEMKLKAVKSCLTCNFPSDVIEMAALGRPLSLGMLYNSQSNSFCQDILMWDEDTLASMKVSLPRPHTNVKVLENDSLQERFRVLEMSPVLQVGTQTGKIQMNGAAAFLNHPQQSQHQERATLHYRTTTRLDMISQRLLQEAVPSVLVGQTTATHVVTAVYFGGQAFFVFDSSNYVKNAKIVDILKKMTSTFCSNHIISNLSAGETAKSSSLACSLYIDVGDWKSPVSFDKAVEIYVSLPALLGSKGERAVPLKVCLYPLKKLDKSSVCAALSGVTENLMHQAENILEHLRKQIRICQDMITDYINIKVIMCFPTLEDKLIKFLELLQEYQTKFQKEITDVVHIKEGKRERSLQDLLERHSQSLFSAESTNQWLDNKETELKMLNDCRAADITVVKSQAEIQQIISHSQITRVMCLTLFSPDVEDPLLAALRQHIESDDIMSHDSLLLKPVSITEKVLIKVQLFIAANEDAEQTKFIAASIPDCCFPEYSVQFYRDGRIVSRNVKLGTNADLTQISHIKHTSVSLKLKQPQTKNIERYIVEYRALGHDESNNNTWKQIVFDSTVIREPCMISDLKSGHQYQLRYIFIEQDCMNFSRIMNFQTVVAATPGQPLVNKVDRDTLRVTWLRAEADEGFPVLQYMVEYKEAGLEGWSSVLTQGPQCECTLTVPHSTCYRVRVSAVYEDITSKPSVETPVLVDVWSINLSKRQSSILLEVLKLQTEKKPVELIDWTDEESEVRGFLQCLPYISQLSENYTNLQCDFLLDLYSHVKNYETQTGRSVLPALQPIYQSVPAVWIINLSERKSSILLEVLKLQTEKKPVELIDWTDEEHTLRGFFQCLPYISQLRFSPQQNRFSNETEMKKRLLALNLTFQEPTLPKEIIEASMETLFSYMYYGNWDFLLDLYSNVKDYETQTGRSVLPVFYAVYQSAPAVWIINLSERKSSILLEVLKLQTEKKPVELREWTDEESEVRGFLQCLPYISQLRFNVCLFDDEKQKTAVQFLTNLSVAASERDEATGECFTVLLISVCSYTSFPCDNYDCYNCDHGCYEECQTKRCDFLLDLYSHMKKYKIQTGRSVLPVLQSIYRSAPAVWTINLSERKSSILLEVLKLQTEKKPVELRDWTDEESEVRGFLQCLPYISQLRSPSQNEYLKVTDWRLRLIVLDMCLQVPVLKDEITKTSMDTLHSYISYGNFDFLLDLYSHMKIYETQTGRSVLPALQVIFQSAPAVWIIDLSERKSSILLEVLKLQTEKKPVELRDWTDEESEVRGFLQCLPYISQLRSV
ncbi:Neoverrucotoxin subunit alpha [Anabarilius grahami]|uniref:Neoverrucotoxin subunit alpha n=1 Tax=Anabarilius grahami TaxID=495550 RepID=A0A3N0Y068_ANAGA|nr:Neoverrucotoxin subunit alpha [Anabarilius grahami]